MARTESLPVSLTRRDRAAVGGDSQFTTVWLAGEHDASTKLAVASVIARASELDGVDVLVDLSEVTFMDCSIIGTLISARNRLAARSLSLRVRAPSPSALLVLELCGLTDSLQSATRAPLHPIGASAALGTWVDVPSHQATVSAETHVPEPAIADVHRTVS